MHPLTTNPAQQTQRREDGVYRTLTDTMGLVALQQKIVWRSDVVRWGRGRSSRGTAPSATRLQGSSLPVATFLNFRDGVSVKVVLLFSEQRHAIIQRHVHPLAYTLRQGWKVLAPVRRVVTLERQFPQRAKLALDGGDSASHQYDLFGRYFRCFDCRCIIRCGHDPSHRPRSHKAR